MGGGAFLGMRISWAWIFVGELTVWVSVPLSFTWSIFFLLGHVYLMSESLWHL
jgi:hypothetical protein